MTFTLRPYQQELKLLLVAAALLMAAPAAHAGNVQTWGCTYNNGPYMRVNIAWGSGGFSVRWQDGVSNAYRYAPTPGPTTVIDRLGGKWRYSFWDAHFTLENMANGNVIACTP